MPSQVKQGGDSAHRSPIPAAAIAVMMLVGLGLWAYWPAISRVSHSWSHDPDYSHGYLVAPLALLFLWLRRAERPAARLGFHPLGLLVLVAAGLLRYLAGRLFLPELDAWSVPLWIGGVIWTLTGWSILRWALPSLAFLWFASPLPSSVAIALSTPLQVLAAKLSGIVLQLFGQPAVVEGTTILLGNQTLEVEQACSGLRMFYGITALAFATILLMRPGMRKSICLLLSVAPVAIVVNVLRITANGLLLDYSSSETVQYLTHELSGVAVIPLAVFLFIGILWLFDRIADAWHEDVGRTSRWLLGAFVMGLAVAIATGYWYGVQKDKALGTLLLTADKYEQQGDWQQAVNFLERYLQIRPDDSVQQARLAVTFAQAAGTTGEQLRAAELLRVAYRADPTRRDLAYQAIDLAVQTESYRMAIELLGELDSSAASLPEDEADKLVRKRADVLLAYLNSPEGGLQSDHTWSDVAAALEQSLARDDYPTRHAAALADVVRQHLTKPAADVRTTRADALINQLVVDRAGDPEARLARYRYGNHYWADDKSYDPDADLDRALKDRAAAPPAQQVEILLAAAERSLRNDPTGEGAREFLENAISALPAAVPPYLALAAIDRQAGDAESAINVLRSGMDATHQASELVIALAEVFAANGSDDESEKLLTAIRSVLPRISDGPTRGYLTLGIATAESIQAQRQGRTAEAARILQSVLDTTDVALAAGSRYAGYVSQAWRQLAEYCASLGRRNQALAASRQAFRLSPNSRDARTAFVAAAFAAGDFETAIIECRRRVQQDPESGDAWVALAAAELQQQLQLPPDRRDLSDAQRSLAQAMKLPAAKVPLVVLSVDLLRAQNRRPQARQLLEKTLRDDPEQPRLWQALAVTLMEVADPTAALDAVNQLSAHGGSLLTATALRASILVDTGHSGEAVELLEALQKKLHGKDQLEITLLAAALQRQLGSPAKARSMLEQAHHEHPTELGPLERLAQYAAADRDWVQLAGWEQQLRGLEGDVGTLWKSYRVMRLLATAGQLDREQQTELTKLVQAIVDTRPRWSTGHYLLAQTALGRGDNDEAIRQLELAWKLGLHDAPAAKQLLTLLTSAGRPQEVEQYVSEMADLALTSPGIYDLLIPALFHSGRGERALTQAQQWARENPADSQSYLRLGRAYLTYAETLDADAQARDRYLDNAEKAFREAIRRAPASQAAWSSLFTFFVQMHRLLDASELVDRFEREAELEPVEKQLAIAQFNDALARTAAAVRSWRQAVNLAQQQPDVALRVSTLSQAATYFAASAPRSAEAYCRSAIEADASAAVPRLILVRLLGAQDEQGATEEALKIVDGLPDDRPRMSAEKRRLTARLLANRNKPGDIEKAIELVDALKVQKTEDKLLLAELYSQLGRTAAAYELFDDVVTSPSARAEDFVAFLEFWQKHFQAERQFGHRAQEVLTRLGQLPEGLPEQLRWKIRLAKTSVKESDEASTALVLEEFWASPAAKRAWKDEQAGPALLYNVLSVLLDEGCLDEAVQVCRQPPGPITPQFAARLLANVIMMRHAEDAALVDAGEKLLDELLAKFPTDVQLLQDAGDLASVGGHNDRAAAMYERVLAIDPHHESARNNLATIWNLDVARRPAALESVRKALAEHPEASSLLNTEGEILLQLDRDAEALKVLTTAANIESNSPIVYLHMAMAQDKLGRRPAAEEALVVAAALGVEGRPLSPSDREAVAELKSKYEL